MTKITLSILLVYLLNFKCCGQNISYLNALDENDRCKLDDQNFGSCRKISDCPTQFEKYRQKEIELKICKYDKIYENILICCPHISMNTTNSQKTSKFIDFTDYEVCQKEYSKFRENSKNHIAFMDYILSQQQPISAKDCQKINDLANSNGKSPVFDTPYYTCHHGFLETEHLGYFGKPVNLGDVPNMAAIGWTQKNGIIAYRCGGSILTEKFILTAAHCKFYERAAADTVRVGDRYLANTTDDEYAQQLKIEKFIIHPEYNSLYYYNDIALIKTVETLLFSEFITPSCIIDLDFKQKSRLRYRYGRPTWLVTGYGETENGTQSDVLLEIEFIRESNARCNQFYEDNSNLPDGIQDSQFCVKSLERKSTFGVPDTCRGDSGSPLQYKHLYEVVPENYNETLITDVYKVYGVIGLVSFGYGACGYDVPSVYTNIYYYRDWIKSTVLNN